MTLSRLSGLAALACAATYIFGFVLLLTLLAPLGFGTGEIDTSAVVAFIDTRGGLLITWNTVIYIVNALALAVLVVGLSDRLRATRPDWAAVTQAFGLIWAALVLGAGMIANIGVEQAMAIYPNDPIAAADIWDTMHAVELGLGGGNEIAGGVWILTVSLAAFAGRLLPRGVTNLGLITGAGGFLTIIPALGETPGAVFGLGAIVWFIAAGISLVLADRKGAAPAAQAQ